MSNPREIQVTKVNGVAIPEGQSEVPIQFLGDRILIERFAPTEWLDKKNDIKKPADFKEMNMTGRIVSIGGSEYGISIPKSITTGLTVVYYHQGATNFDLDDGKKYDLVRGADVIAIP